MPDAARAVRELVEGTTLSRAEIAARTGISLSTVSVWMRKHGWRRPLDAYRCTRLVAIDRAGLGAPLAAGFRRIAAGFRRIAALAEREAERMAATPDGDPDAAKAMRRLAKAAARQAVLHDRSGLGRAPVIRPPDNGWGLIRLSAAPPEPRHITRTDDVVAQARDLVERTTMRLDEIARHLGIWVPTLIAWRDAGAWSRLPNAPKRYGEPMPSPNLIRRSDDRRVAWRRLREADELLAEIEAGERATAERIAAAFAALDGVRAALRGR